MPRDNDIHLPPPGPLVPGVACYNREMGGGCSSCTGAYTPYLNLDVTGQKPFPTVRAQREQQHT